MRYSVLPSQFESIDQIKNWIDERRGNAIYIAQTNNTVKPIDIAIPLHSHFKDLDILVTISTKYYQTVEEIVTIISEATKENLTKFLIVSGYPKTDLDAITVIKNINLNVDIYCAYNPYEIDMQNENRRLIEKLKNPQVTGICLQIGIDPQKLEAGIQFIKSHSDKLIIEGCIIEPTPLTLQRLKDKPIHGVYISERFLSDREYAIATINSVHEIYTKFAISEIYENFAA